MTARGSAQRRRLGDLRPNDRLEPPPRALAPGEAAGFGTAVVLGSLHAGFSFYWAAGGTALVWSLGADLVETFHGREGLLLPVALVKLVAAVAPLVLAGLGWPSRRLTRTACWFGASLLILWGGVNTAAANLVLAGVIEPGEGFDLPGMIGHAYLWDPLFLAWGAAIAVGLAFAPLPDGRPKAARRRR